MSYRDVVHDVDRTFAAPVESKTLARWERKALASAAAGSSSTVATPSSSSSAVNSSSGASCKSQPTTPGRTSSASAGSGKTPGKRRTPYGCRFIPQRDAMNKDLQLHATNENSAPGSASNGGTSGCTCPCRGSASAVAVDSDVVAVPAKGCVCVAEGRNCSACLGTDFNSKLAGALFEGESANSKVLAFKSKPKPSDSHLNGARVLYSLNRQSSSVGNGKTRNSRHVSSTPIRVLDAPGIEDDFYLNILDWSSRDVMAVGLQNAVYLWNPETGSADTLLQLEDEDNIITSVRFMENGSHLAVGTKYSEVQLWNLDKQRQVRSLRGHEARVSSLSWNKHILTSGGRDSNIFHHDVRVSEHLVGTLRAHEQEICGLAWSPDGSQLASGGNDNKLCIWQAGEETPAYEIAHNAAVKALAWCPWQSNVLATGAGTADRHIRMFNSRNGSLLNSVDTGSQVSTLCWSTSHRELLSGHGFSENQLTLWKYPSLTPIANLKGHTERILGCSLSPDGSTAVSVAADETVRFWKVWDEPARGKHLGGSSSGDSRSRGFGARGIR